MDKELEDLDSIFSSSSGSLPFLCPDHPLLLLGISIILAMQKDLEKPLCKLTTKTMQQSYFCNWCTVVVSGKKLANLAPRFLYP